MCMCEYMCMSVHVYVRVREFPHPLYISLQEHMANAHSNLGDHTFGAPPHNWPLMGKTLPYWLDETSNAQVTLLGNPILWWVSTGAIHVFSLLTTIYLMRRRRQHMDMDEGTLLHAVKLLLMLTPD